MTRRNIPILACLLLLGACAAQPVPPTASIWSPAERRYLSESEAMERIADAPIVLLGESHDNALHHRLQARLVAALAARGQKRALAFEMIGQDLQPALDSYQAHHGGQAAGLGEALDWAKRGWPDFAMYQPIFQAGLDGKWPIVAANLSQNEVRLAAKPGGLDPKQEAGLGLTTPLSGQLAQDLRQELIESHCGLLPESALPAMMRIQLAWDGQMARSLYEAKQPDGAVLIAGSEHARKDRAVPRRLAGLAPSLKVLALAFKEQTDPPTPPETADWPYDLVWFTPHREAADHCAELREHMKKKKKEEAKPNGR